MNRLAVIKEAISGSSYTKIQLERKEEVATIWLNSPKDLNALSEKMLSEITRAIVELNDDSTVKVILLRSRLEKIFCAGADIKEFQTRDVRSYPYCLNFRKVETIFRQHHKPIVAVVQGKALGGGFEITLLSDVVLCSEKAQFGVPEVTLGLIPGIGGTQILPRIVGEKVANRMIMTGLPIDAKEAHRLNIAHLLPTENFEQAVSQIVGAMANKSLDALIAANKAVKIAFQTTLDQGLQHEASIFQNLFISKGAKEGISAFLEKRKPSFKGI